MHVRPHNPKVDLAVSKTRRRSRSGAGLNLSFGSVLLATCGIFLFLIAISQIPSKQARNFGGLACIVIVGLLISGRILNNRELGWAKRRRSLSADQVRRGRDRSRAHRAPRPIAERARGKVHVRKALVTGRVRDWKRGRAPWGRVLAMVLILGAWAYLVGSLLATTFAGMGRGLHIPVVMIVFVISMALGFRVASYLVFPAKRTRMRRGEEEMGEPREESA